MDVGYGDHVGNIGRPAVSAETRKVTAMPLEWHPLQGGMSDNDSTDRADTMRHLNGTLRISALDAPNNSEPEDTADSPLAGTGSASTQQ